MSEEFPERKERSKSLLPCGCAIAAVLLLVGGGIISLILVATFFWVDKDAAVATSRKWARLEPLPPSARNLTAEKKGSAFTREFVIRFEADPAEVTAWLKQSPGTSGAETEVLADGSTTYKIVPGGGAQFAEVTVSADRGQVIIRTFWS